MLRSLYSGVSGMKGFQTQMDVIANNVSNVNTHGFKAGRVLFQDMVSQNTTSASAPGLGLGGVNGKQVGLGMQTGAVDTMTGRGNMESTGQDMDLYIQGEGYFVVRKEATADSDAVTYYTRDGAFKATARGCSSTPMVITSRVNRQRETFLPLGTTISRVKTISVIRTLRVQISLTSIFLKWSTVSVSNQSRSIIQVLSLQNMAIRAMQWARLNLPSSTTRPV